MHSSPSLEDKILFVRQNRIQLWIAGSISTAVLMAGNLYFVLAHPGFLVYGLYIAVVGFYLGVSYLVGFLGKDFHYQNHRDLVAKWFDHSVSASVDIYLPICGEPFDVIKNTWKSVAELKRRHPHARVYVLDDGKSDEAKSEAERLGFDYIRRPTNELKKAGNMRYAFAQTDGEFIAIFDADFCPRVDFLLETLAHFFEKREVAIVQTPQFFRVYDWNTWIQRGAGAIQELFYRLIQVNRNTFNGAICVGTNAVYRRESLIPFGGTAPMAYSEDVHTGFQVIAAGWRIEYIPVVLAEGLCPETLKQFFTQQYRWALGSISLFFSARFWRTELDFLQRVSYLSGMFYYITTGLAVVFGSLPGLLMLVFFPEKMMWFNLLFSVPSFFFSTCYMWHWMKLPMSLDVLRVRHVSYFAHLFALRDFLFDSLEEWKPTGAKTSSKRYETFITTYRLHTLLIPLAVFGLLGIRIAEGHAPVNFILLGLFTAYNFYVASRALEDL